jgi:hypothetical protein
MKLYRIQFQSADEGLILGWASSKIEAARKRRELRRDFGEAQGLDVIEAIEMPTDKAGLIRWLNANLTRDNG